MYSSVSRKCYSALLCKFECYLVLATGPAVSCKVYKLGEDFIITVIYSCVFACVYVVFRVATICI